MNRHKGKKSTARGQGAPPSGLYRTEPDRTVRSAVTPIIVQPHNDSGPQKQSNEV